MKRTLILPVLLALAACGSGASPSLERAKSEYAEQDYAAAQRDLVSLLRDDPGNRELLELLAQAQLRQGDGDGAQATIAKLKAAGVNGPSLVRLEAEAVLARGQSEAALTMLGNDNHVDAWRIRAAAKLRLGDALGALNAFKAGLAAGDNYLITFDYARYLLASNQIEEAQGQLATLERLGANLYLTQMFAGDLAASSGQNEKALASYQQAAKAHPDRIEPLLSIVNIHDMQGQLDMAKQVLAQAAEKAPDDTRVTALQLQLASESGDWEKVRSMLASRESSLDPMSSEGMAYAEALLRLDHPEQARAIFQRVLLVSPINPYARLRLGEAQLATGDPAAAWTTLKPLVSSFLVGKPELELAEKAARDAGDPAADGLRARINSPQFAQIQKLVEEGNRALFRRDWAVAANAFSQLSTMGDDAEIYKRLAQALSGLGRHDEAIAAADKALVLQPDNSDMQHMAGYVRTNAGRDLAHGIELLKQAFSADPANLTYMGTLAKALAAAG